MLRRNRRSKETKRGLLSRIALRGAAVENVRQVERPDFESPEAARLRQESRERQRLLRERRLLMARRVRLADLSDVPGLVPAGQHATLRDDLARQATRRVLERRHASAQQRVELYRSRRSELMPRLSELQRHIREGTAEIARINRQIAALSSSEDSLARRELALAELEGIRQLPGVTGISVNPDTQYCRRGHSVFVIRVEPRPEEDGVVYDFGDWDVSLCNCRTRNPLVVCVRKGLIRYGDRETVRGEFCFGDRGSVVASMMEQGEILVALALTIEAIHGLNQYHEMHYAIDEYFAVSSDAATMPAVPRPRSVPRSP
jgi:hypothetical protein